MAIPLNLVGPPTAAGEPAGLDAAAEAAVGGGFPAIGKPDPYGDDKALLKTFQNFRDECFDQRLTFERVWWRNLLYTLGRHWIYYGPDGVWRDKRMAKWIPRPVTNKIGETVDTIASLFQSVRLGVTARPEGAAPLDVMTAETSTKLEPAIRLEHEMDWNQRISDWWLVVTGNAFWHPWWNKLANQGQVLVPYEQCDACGATLRPDELQQGGVCPACGAAAFSASQELLDVSPGRGQTDICSPFEIALPMWLSDFNQTPGLIRKRWRTRLWYEAHHADLVKGVNWEKMSADRSLQMLRGLASLTELSGQAMFGTFGHESVQTEGLTEYELWLKPTKDYARGLLLRVIGEGEQDARILRLDDEGLPGPLPYETRRGEPIFPWIQAAYKRIGGRVWGGSPLDSIIQKNDQINQIDSLMQMIISRVANPVWLEPKGSEVKKFTGEPGVVVKYVPSLVAGGAKPERLAGENIPASLPNIRQMLMNDIESLVGTFDVIKGQKPAGVEAFSAMQLLVERSQSRFSPVLAERGACYCAWYTVALELERQFGPDERVFAILGPNSSWTFQEFKKANLQGGVRLVVEDGSDSPKTSLGKRAAIEQLRQMQAINPQNPDTAYRVLQAFGQTDLWPGLDSDVKSALQEQDEFERWARGADLVPNPSPIDPRTGGPAVDPNTGQPMQTGATLTDPNVPGERMEWHSDEMHLSEHRKWMNGDSIRQLLSQKRWLRAYLAQMLQQHEAALAAKQMAAAMGPGAAPGGSPRPMGADGAGVGGGRAMVNANAEAGNPNDVPHGQREQVQRQGPR